MFVVEFFSSSKIRRKSLRNETKRNDRSSEDEKIVPEEIGEGSSLPCVSSSKGEGNEEAMAQEQQIEKPNPSEKRSSRREGNSFGERPVAGRAGGVARRCLEKFHVELHGDEKEGGERQSEKKSKKSSSNAFGTFQLLTSFSQRGQLMRRKRRAEDRRVAQTLRITMRWKNAVQKKKITRQTGDGRVRTRAQPRSVRWTSGWIRGDRHVHVSNRNVSFFFFSTRN